MGGPFSLAGGFAPEWADATLAALMACAWAEFAPPPAPTFKGE